MLRKLSVAALLMAAISGCASGGGSPKINVSDLNDPTTTPVEKWSDALRYLDAMGIYGMRDVPGGLFANSPGQSAEGGPSYGALDAASLGLSAASPPTGISGGVALGIGVGLMLLSGPVQPVQVTQIAAWVPSDLASSTEEAVRLVEQKYNEAREKVFVKKLPQDINLTKYPSASGMAFDNKFPSKSNLVLFSEPAKESPWFIDSEISYGPIFIRDHLFSQETMINTKGIGNVQGSRNLLVDFSAALPEWIVIYDTAKSFSRTNKAPPVVLVAGAAHYFIGK